MKTNKIFSALFGAALVAGFTACTDEVDYQGAQKTPGFYFPVENVSAVELSEDGTSFNITVGRVTDETAAVTVDIRNNFNSSEFHMPISVVFAEGELVKTVPVYYDGATLAPGTYKLEIGFYEHTTVSQYGYPQLNITATMPEPEVILPWNDLGECTFTDPFLTSGFYTYFTKALTYKVHIEQSGDDPNLYRLVAPYGTAFLDAMMRDYPEEDWANDDTFGYDKDNSQYLYFTAIDGEKVIIEPQEIAGAISTGHGVVTVLNDAGYEAALVGTPIDEIPEESFGILKDGILTLPARNALANVPGANPNNPGGIYYTNSSNSVKMVVMPGVVAGDYAANVTYVGQFNNAQTGQITAVASIEFGADVTAATAALVRGGSGAAANAGELLKAGQLAGAINVDLKNPTVSFPIEAGGEWSIVVATFDGAEAQDAGSASFEALFYADDAAWEPLGYGQMADGWILALFGEDQFDYGYEVAVSESKANPGIYRLKAPWGPGTPLSNMNQATTTTDVFIDTRDEELIVIMPQNSGFEFAPQLNYINVCNREGYMLNNGYTRDELVALKGRVDNNGIPYITTTMEEDAQVGYIITVENSWIIGNGSVFGGTGAGYVDTSVVIIPFKADQGGEGEGGEGEEGGETSVAPKLVRANAANVSRTFKSRFHIATPVDVTRVSKNAAIKANL